MVRNFPIGESPRNNPLLSHTFIIAFIAATIAIVSFLCGKKKRKRSLSSNSRTTRPKENTGLLNSRTTDRTNEATHVKIEEKNDDSSQPESTIQNQNKELPPPPRLAIIRAASYHVGESSSRFQGVKLTSSMSMRLSGRMKGLKKGGSKKNEIRNNQILENSDKRLTRQDSVLEKPIILGGKCRIPDEDEDDIILDENGQRITTFHRKQSCSTLSRQSSGASTIRNGH